jgi:hypothetical protein
VLTEGLLFGGAGAGDDADDGTGSGTESRLVIPLGQAADHLDVHLFAVWREGAFDPVTFTAQGWKQAPKVGSVVVGQIQPSVTLVHEEWQ